MLAIHFRLIFIFRSDDDVKVLSSVLKQKREPAEFTSIYSIDSARVFFLIFSRNKALTIAVKQIKRFQKKIALFL